MLTPRGAAVSWKSSKKTLIVHSKMEYEFIALDKTTEEVEWLRCLLEDVLLWSRLVSVVFIHLTVNQWLQEHKM